MVCKLEVAFLVIAVEDGWLIPTAGSADGGYLIAVLRSDGVGAIAELEVLGLGEVLYQSLADALGVALRDDLVEVEHAAAILTFALEQKSVQIPATTSLR